MISNFISHDCVCPDSLSGRGTNEPRKCESESPISVHRAHFIPDLHSPLLPKLCCLPILSRAGNKGKGFMYRIKRNKNGKFVICTKTLHFVSSSSINTNPVRGMQPLKRTGWACEGGGGVGALQSHNLLHWFNVTWNSMRSHIFLHNK